MSQYKFLELIASLRSFFSYTISEGKAKPVSRIFLCVLERPAIGCECIEIHTWHKKKRLQGHQRVFYVRPYGSPVQTFRGQIAVFWYSECVPQWQRPTASRLEQLGYYLLYKSRSSKAFQSSLALGWFERAPIRRQLHANLLVTCTSDTSWLLVSCAVTLEYQVPQCRGGSGQFYQCCF